MEDRTLSEKESISLITSMIARTKKYSIGDGALFNLLCNCVILCNIYAVVFLRMPSFGLWHFFCTVILGIAVCVVLHMETARRKCNERMNYTDKVIEKLWIMTTVVNAIGFCIVVGCRLLIGVDLSGALLGCSLLMVSFAEIAQGLFSRERSMLLGGLSGLAAGFATVFLVYVSVSLYSEWYLIMLCFVFLAMIGIPAYTLKRRKSLSE